MSSINLKKSFKVALANREIDQKDLAEKLKVTKQYLTNVVSGRCAMSVSKLDEVANELGYKLHEFLALADTPSIKK